jgi:D-arabinose 1-dehydrogenase-like Zn-dependent alcohol dehydrogenase
MRAAVLEEYGEPLSVRSVDAPAPDPDGVVIETEACGICRSDWHAWQGHWDWAEDIYEPVPTGQILGHETAGTVAAVGENVETVSVGDVITVPFNLADGTCGHCRRGDSHMCENGLDLGFAIPGAYAQQVHVPAADYNATRLPDSISPVEAAGLGCRFMTAFHALCHQADVTAGDRVAVHGCGGVGLSAIHIADALGSTVIAVDIKKSKLDRAEELGASVEIDSTAVDDVPSEIRDVTDGGADVSVDALGIAETCQNSIRCLDRKGKHVQIGITTGAEEGVVELPTDRIVFSELEVIGSKGMPPGRYDEIFRMVESGKIDPSLVVSEHTTLDRVSETLAAMTDFETTGVPVITEF